MRYLTSKLLFHSISHLVLPMLNGASNPAGPRAQPLALDHANVGTADLDYSSGPWHRNEKNENAWVCAKWQWNALNWSYWIARLAKLHSRLHRLCNPITEICAELLLVRLVPDFEYYSPAGNLGAVAGSSDPWRCGLASPSMGSWINSAGVFLILRNVIQ